LKRVKIEVKGIVQGVGFRPFVYNLAKKFNLKGFVLNNGNGVEIELEGSQKAIDNFKLHLISSPPPLAKIESIKIQELKLFGFKDFKIKKSKESKKTTLIPADSAVCKECLAEMRDKNNRRFGYALINCTNCGPRYSIIKSLPYDRKNTSMNKFKMCKECEAEYNDPKNRRYHAQPIGCFKCGPKLSLEIKGEILKLEQKELIKKAALLLKEGKILAIKGIGGFHLVCDATNKDALKNLRKRKKRPKKPFAIMVKDLKMANSLVWLSKKEEEILNSNIRPILLAKSKNNKRIAKEVAPDLNILGVMLPYTPIHYLLFDYLEFPIVATSANISKEPIIGDSKELKEKLGEVFDALLDFDREIINRCDDSVIMVVEEEVFPIRVARGIAPVAIKLDFYLPKKVLAVGANQKSTVAIGFEDQIILSPHIGDLETIESVNFFEKNINILKKFYEFFPEEIVRDLHEDYESSKWAKKQNLLVKKVQHHFAHTLALLAENSIDEEVLSFAWDGTGAGEDGTIWGGEILLVNKNFYKRVAHFKNFRLIGATKAIKEPRRVALGLLFEIFSLEEVLNLNIPTTKAFKEFEIKALYKAWKNGINSPKTSSVGRVFDGVASLGGLRDKISFEGESGMLLESKYNPNLKIKKGLLYFENGVIEWKEMIKEIIKSKDLASNILIDSLADLVEKFSQKYPTKKIALTGGVWQNRILLQKILSNKNLKNRLLLPKKLPLNDGAIAVGQILASSIKE
jgi:hydrogenase maturation protein HypF